MTAATERQQAQIAAVAGPPGGRSDPEPLAGDISSRTFFRVRPAGGETAVAVLYPPGEEAGAGLYLATARALSRAGVPVPSVRGEDVPAGAVLVEDCGRETLQDRAGGAGPEELAELYRRAVEILVRMQKRLGREEPAFSPPFDGATFERELLMFLETVEPPGREGTWRGLFSRVVEAALGQPFCFCHRDYHSRNLMVAGTELKVLDFQDCRSGPYTYDPVSLAYDPYVVRDPGRSRRILEDYFALRPRFLRGISRSEFERDCDSMCLQRLLKAAGTYGKVFRATGEEVFLRYLSRSRETAREIVAGRPEFREYLDLFRSWEPPRRGIAEESV